MDVSTHAAAPAPQRSLSAFSSRCSSKYGSRLKEEDRTIPLNSMRIPILLSLLMDRCRIVLIPILCSIRFMHTVEIPETRKDAFHIGVRLSTHRPSQ